MSGFYISLNGFLDLDVEVFYGYNELKKEVLQSLPRNLDLYLLRFNKS